MLSKQLLYHPSEMSVLQAELFLSFISGMLFIFAFTSVESFIYWLERFNSLSHALASLCSQKHFFLHICWVCLNHMLCFSCFPSRGNLHWRLSFSTCRSLLPVTQAMPAGKGWWPGPSWELCPDLGQLSHAILGSTSGLSDIGRNWW